MRNPFLICWVGRPPTEKRSVKKPYYFIQRGPKDFIYQKSRSQDLFCQTDRHFKIVQLLLIHRVYGSMIINESMND